MPLLLHKMLLFKKWLISAIFDVNGRTYLRNKLTSKQLDTIALPSILLPFWELLERNKLKYSKIPDLNETRVDWIAAQHLRAAQLSKLGKFNRATDEFQKAIDAADEFGIDDKRMHKELCVLYTNCHGLAIGRMLSQNEELANKYTILVVRHAGAYKTDDPNVSSEALTRLLKRANVFIYQVGLFGQSRLSPYFPILPDFCKKISIPFATFTTLWPFFYSASEWDEEGVKKRIYPYGDSYVRKLLSQGLSPSEIADEYSKDVFSGVLDLDRFLAIESAKAYSLETNTDVKVREFIEKNFKYKELFRTPFHPTPVLVSHIVTQILDILGEHNPGENVLLKSVDPLPPDELPIHPQIIKHFGIKYLKNRLKFKVLESGDIDFSEFVYRYAAGKIVPK